MSTGCASSASADGVVEELRPRGVAEGVVARHDEAAVVAPAVGVADADVERVELGLRLGARRRRHPVQVVHPLAERDDDVLHHLLRLGLGLRREVLRGVELADRLAERPVGRVDGALPAVAQLGGAGERGAVEGELLVDERLREQRRGAVDGAEGEVVLPGRERLRGGQGGDAGDRARVPDHQRAHLRAPGAETGGVEEGRPVQAGRPGGELGERPAIVGALHLHRLGARRMGGRDLRFEGVDPVGATGALPGLAESGELEQAGDVGAVLGLQSGARRVGGGVVVAVGHAEAALQQIGGVLRRIVEVRRDPEPEQAVGVEVRHVERIDIGAQLGAEEAREGRLVGERGDGGELGLDRLLALRLDGGFVHERQVVVAHLAGVGVGGTGAAGGCLLDQLLGAAVGLLGEDRERAPGGAVGRDLGRLEPGAVGVGEEVVSRGDAAVDAGEVDAGFGLRCVSGPKAGRGQEESEAREPEGRQAGEVRTARGGDGRERLGRGGHGGHYGSAHAPPKRPDRSSHGPVYGPDRRGVFPPARRG